MRSMSAEAECSPKQRQTELERVKSQNPACSRITNTPPGSLLSSFEASRFSRNDTENRLAIAAFVATLWGQHDVILHWEGTCYVSDDMLDDCSLLVCWHELVNRLEWV